MSVCSVCGKKCYPNESENGADTLTHKACFKCSTCNVRLTLKTYKRYNDILYCQQHAPVINLYEKGGATKPPQASVSSPTAAATTTKPSTTGTNVRAPSPGPTSKPTTTTAVPATTTPVKQTTPTTAAPAVKQTSPTTATPVKQTTPTPPVKQTTTAPATATPTPPVKQTTPTPVKQTTNVGVSSKQVTTQTPKPPEPEPEPEPAPAIDIPPPPPPPPADFFDDMNIDAKLLSKLENLTARLESRAGSSGSATNKKESLDAAVSRLSDIVNRLESVAARGPASTSSSGGAGSNAASVQDFNGFVQGSITPFLDLSNKLGGDVQQIAQLLSVVVNAQTVLLQKAASSKKPSQAEFTNLIQPLSTAMTEVNNFKDKNRKSKQSNHLSAVSEGVAVFGWVAVAPTPVPFIKDTVPGAQFWTNKILVEFKGKDQTQIDWANGFIKILNDLADYVKKHHTTGLVWSA